MASERNHNTVCLTLLEFLNMLEIDLNLFYYWKSWNSTVILPGFLEFSLCCGICCDWYDATMDVNAIFPVKSRWNVMSREKLHRLC